MRILAIDPGCKESAFILFESDNEGIMNHGIVPNDVLLDRCIHNKFCNILVIESIEGFGMTAGQELFDTCWWSGRFCQAFTGAFKRIGRKAIKTHLCGNSSAKDKDIRESLIYRFGEQGNKQKPGKLYGISSHVWSALAVAVTHSDSIKIK